MALGGQPGDTWGGCEVLHRHRHPGAGETEERGAESLWVSPYNGAGIKLPQIQNLIKRKKSSCFDLRPYQATLHSQKRKRADIR